MNPHPGGLRKYFLALVAGTLLAGFPLLFSDIGLQYLLFLQGKNYTDRIFSELDEDLIALQPLTNDERVIRRELEKFSKALIGRNTSPESFQRMMKLIEKRYPGLFSVRVFNENGELISKLEKGASRRILERIIKDLIAHRQGQGFRLKAYWPLVEQALGIIEVKVDFSLNRAWYRTSKRSLKTWAFFHFGKRFSAIFHVNQEGLPPMIGLKHWLRTKPNEATSFQLYDTLSRKFFSHLSFRENLLPATEQILSQFEKEPETHFRRQGKLWSVLMLSSRFRLLACRDDRQGSRSAFLQNVYRLFSGFSLLLTLGTIFFFLSRETLPYVSLRKKLLLLFLLSSGLPLLMLGFTGIAFVEERKIGSLQETRQRAIAILRDFDGKLPTVQSHLEHQVKRIMGNMELQNAIEYLRNRYHCKSFHILASSSKVIYPSQKQKKASQEERLVQALIMKILGQLISIRDQKLDPQLKGGDLILSSMIGQDMDTLTEDFIRNLGQINSLELATLRTNVIIDVIRGKTGKPEFIYSMKWSDSDLFRAYFQRSLPSKPLSDGSVILAVNSERDRVRYQANLQKVLRRGEPAPRFLQVLWYYPNRPMTRALEGFIRKTIRANRAQHGVLSYRNKKYLISGIPGANLKKFFLFRLFPKQVLEKEIRNLSVSLWSFGGLSLAFTTSLGMLLAASVLRPVHDLSQGVMAVRESRLKHRVPEQVPDELGDLANLFNMMIESLQEVATAKVVQEALFPQMPLQVGDYKVYGVSWTASELGGDYFDYLKIGSECLLVLIGDVTGHGVPAALVMAMSKSLVLDMAKKESSPLTILESLNRIINETVYKKKRLFMSLGAVFINTRTHQTELFGCGHPHPIGLFNDGSNAYIPTPASPPLGVRNKLMCRPIALDLKPKDMLCFFTDGLPESICFEKDANNFELFLKYVSGRARLGVEEAPEDILKNHPFVLSGNPQPDDFTVVCVQRLSAPLIG